MIAKYIYLLASPWFTYSLTLHYSPTLRYCMTACTSLTAIHLHCSQCGGLQALAELLPAVAQKQVGKGGFLILRPDSGTSLPLLSMSMSLFAC